MPVLRRLSVSSVVPALAVTMALVAACSGSTSPAPPSSDTFCEAATNWALRCGATDTPCDGDLVTDCNDYSSLLNTATLDSARDCLETAKDCTTTHPDELPRRRSLRERLHPSRRTFVPGRSRDRDLSGDRRVHSVGRRRRR